NRRGVVLAQHLEAARPHGHDDGRRALGEIGGDGQQFVFVHSAVIAPPCLARRPSRRQSSAATATVPAETRRSPAPCSTSPLPNPRCPEPARSCCWSEREKPRRGCGRPPVRRPRAPS